MVISDAHKRMRRPAYVTIRLTFRRFLNVSNSFDPPKYIQPEKNGFCAFWNITLLQRI